MHAAATGTRERPASVGGFVVRELSVSYACPSRLATRRAAHVTPFSPGPVGDAHATTHCTCTHADTVWTRYRHDAYVLIQHVRTHAYTNTRGHTRTDKSAHDTTTATTVRIPTDMSRRRRRRLSRLQQGARAGRRAGGQARGRPAGLWESPLRWPATGSDVRRGVWKVRSRPVRFIHEPWYTRALAVPVPDRRALYSF